MVRHGAEVPYPTSANMRGHPEIATFIALAIFAIVFGIEEAIIVVYLRNLPASYAPHAYALEIGREACTLVVIGAIAWVATTSNVLRARAFCFAFGVWDIVYYITLWQLTGYPRLADDDVLFLIPVPWLAPVWSAVTLALAFIAIGLLGVTRSRLALLATGFALALLSFVYRATFHAEAYPVWLFGVALFFVALALLRY